MALKKEIILDNGIIVKYHRINNIQKITNKTTIIEISSYIDENQRNKEIEYYAINDINKSMNVFIVTTYIEKEYNETDTIEEIYNYLKTIEMFKDAEDV